MAIPTNAILKGKIEWLNKPLHSNFRIVGVAKKYVLTHENLIDCFNSYSLFTQKSLLKIRKSQK